jgi:hypothetical protein
VAKPAIEIPDEYQLEELRSVLRAIAALQAEINLKQSKALASSDLAAVYVQAEASLRQLEVVYKAITELGRKLQQEVVPETFRNGKVTSVTSLGYRVTISTVVRASIRKDMKEPAFSWLRQEGHGDIIKVEPTVHPETLAAWGRAELEMGNELPEALFSIYTFDTTSLTKANRK